MTLLTKRTKSSIKEAERRLSRPPGRDGARLPRQQFLEDPITVAYGVGGEFVSSIACAVCDDNESEGQA